MVRVSELVQDFIVTFDVSLTDGDDLYKNMLHTKYDPMQLLSYITSNKAILTHKIGMKFFFDFIYNKVIHEKGEHPNTTEIWKNILLTSLDLVRSDVNYKLLCENKRYLLDLQSNNKSFIPIFKHLLDAKFEIGDFEFLLYSVVARGELTKFKILEPHIKDKCNEYKGLISVALRYGRYQLIEYILSKFDINIYGRILDFEHYQENFRYLYYNQEIYRTQIDPNLPPMSCAMQDYERSLELILPWYKKPVTVETIHIWCEFIRNKTYYWDTISAPKVLEILRCAMIEPVPLLEDFAEYNSIIFGHWGERRFLVEKCQQLELCLLRMTERYENYVGI